MRNSKRIAVALGLSVWATVAAGGMGLLMASTRRPDPQADARPFWPAGLTLRHVPGEPTIIVCLHPRCPCSDATLDALREVLAAAANASAYVVFALPEQAYPGWANAALVNQARSIKGLKVILDSDGRQSALLGARSSGQTFVYDADGRLAFTGGLTIGRGERGQTVGASVLAGALAGRPVPKSTVRTDVFGCALYRSSREAAR